METSAPVCSVRHFAVFGVGAALWQVGIVVAIGAGNRSEWLLPLPIVALELVALFWPRVRGWGRRLALGVAGLVVTAITALLTIRALSQWTDWYDYPADQGALLFFAILLAIAAIPGAIAASCASLRRGLALAGSFTGTLCLVLVVMAIIGPGGASPWGLVVLLLLGPLPGATVGGLGSVQPSQ